MADNRGIPGNHALLFRLEDALQVTCWGWYVHMQYLTDDSYSLLSKLQVLYSAAFVVSIARI
jgi:hypothetical protein